MATAKSWAISLTLSRSVEKISQTLQEYRGILQRLFPDTHPDQLKELSREKLAELITLSSVFQSPSPRTPSVEEKPPTVDPDAECLEQFQPLPDESTDDPVQTPDTERGIADNVSMLSLSVKHNSCYLGISSIMAALRAITWIDPECLAIPDDGGIEPTCESAAPSESHATSSSAPHPEAAPSPGWTEIDLINAYFIYVHPLLPLIDEQTFRDTYMAGQRTDSRWLLLMNAVLAMGAVAIGDAQDPSHQIYFARISQHLTIDLVGSPRLETVQAFVILGGVYFHYVQLPNQAAAIMAATLRIATMLGLHRDYSEGVGTAKAQISAASLEMRRRIWWTAFMLDTWAGCTLGRPTMGRMNHAVTAKPPQEPISGSEYLLTLVQESIRFSVISTKVEDALATTPLLEEHERRAFDAMYLDWYKHSSVQDRSGRPGSSESPGIAILENVLRWRYLHHRSLLHRPVLLWYAMRKMPADRLSPERKAAIELCREVCGDLIHDIATTWRAQKPCTMSAWPATWLLYQATMVPLLSLYSDPRDMSIVESSRQQVETAMQALKDQQNWSLTAARSLVVAARLYEASKRHGPKTKAPRAVSRFKAEANHPSAAGCPHQQSSTGEFRPTYIDVSLPNTYGDPRLVNTPGEEIFMDNMFDNLKWTTSWDSPIGGPPVMHAWDYDSVQNWGAAVPQVEDYFDVGFVGQHSQLGYDMGMPASASANNSMNNQYGHPGHRHPSTR